MVPTLDEMADEDAYTVTAYRMLAIAVRNEQRAFAYFAYVAAHAADRELRQLAEDLAHERLGHAATLRRERRKAWRRKPRGPGCRPPPQSLGELRSPRVTSRGRHGGTAWCAGRGRSRPWRSCECRGTAQRCRRSRGAAPGSYGRGADRRRRAAGASRRLRPAARCPRRPRRRLRYLPARGRGSGRGRSDARRAALGRERPAAERLDSWSVDGVGARWRSPDEARRRHPTLSARPWTGPVRGRLSPVLPGFRRLGSAGDGACGSRL